MSERLKKLGALLRDTRIEKGLSLRQMARKLKRSPAHVSRVEVGDYPTALGTLERWISLLELDRDTVLHLAQELPSEVSSWLLDSPENVAAVRKLMARLQPSG